MAIGKNSLRGIVHEDFHYPFLVSGGTAVNASDVGAAVTLDTAAENTVKLAVDGSSILGVLASYENRVAEGTVNGAVPTRGGYRFTVKPDASGVQIPVVGDYLVGAVNASSKGGFVRKATDPELAAGKISKWLVVEVEGTGATVVAIKA